MIAFDRARRAFTLVELLVVITIIGILIGLLVPAVNMAREAARRGQCLNNVKQICTATQNYLSVHKQFPINWGKAPENGGPTTKGHSWLTMILPQLEMGNTVYRQIAMGEQLNYENSQRRVNNMLAAQTRIETFICPSDTHDGLTENQFLMSGKPIGVTNYKACGGSNWIGTSSGKYQNRKAGSDVNNPKYTGRNFDQYDGRDKGDGVICRGYGPENGAPIPTADFEVRDGMTHTFLLGEAVVEYTGWCSWYWWNGATATCGIPLNYQEPGIDPRAYSGTWRDNWGFHSRHPGGGNFGFCGGSARFISDEIDLDIYYALATIDGGEVIQGEY